MGAAHTRGPPRAADRAACRRADAPSDRRLALLGCAWLSVLKLLGVRVPAHPWAPTKPRAARLESGLGGGSSTRQQEAPAQQIEARSAEHLALQELELVHLALGLAVTPWETDSCRDSRPVTAQAGREAAQLGEVAVLRLFHP